MQNDIISLRQTSENSWQAKYQGNYGIYTIKITMRDGDIVRSSCSCPSDYDPCKHISMIQKAIRERLATDDYSNDKKDKIDLPKVLSSLTKKQLVDFIVQQTKRDYSFRDVVLLAFADKLEGENRYSSIIRSALSKEHFNMDNYYQYEYTSYTIDALDMWIEKAHECQKQEQFAEAEAICKACIEEFATWSQRLHEDAWDYINDSYVADPFEILMSMADEQQIDVHALCRYCFAEVKKAKYNQFIAAEFYDLLAAFADESDGDFIASQDALLQEEESSFDEERIITRKIRYYEWHDQPEKALSLLKENVHFAGFRVEYITHLIQEKNFTEAKTLLRETIANGIRSGNRWQELLLSIAQQEKDTLAIREITWGFLEQRFHPNYYRLAKSTFEAKEWAGQVEQLIAHYRKNSSYQFDSLMGLLIEEKRLATILEVLQASADLRQIESYHVYVVNQYPAEILELFRKKIKADCETTQGRGHYEYIARLLKKMDEIKGGRAIVSELIEHFKTSYKRRTAMMETLREFEKGRG